MLLSQVIKTYVLDVMRRAMLVVDSLASLARRRWVVAVAVWGVSLVLLVVGVLQSAQTITLDSGVFLTVGSMLLDGKVPYRDIWDHKPPGIYWIDAFAISLLGNTVASVRLLELLVDALVVLVLYHLVRLLGGGRWALAVVVGGAVYLPLGAMIAGGNRPEVFLVLPVALAYWLLMSSFSRQNGPRILVGVCAAVLIGIAALLKPTAILHALVHVLYVALGGAARRTGRDRIAAIGVYLFGISLPILTAALYLYMQGALFEAFWQILTYNGYYSGSRDFAHSFSALRDTFYLLWPMLQAPAVLALYSVYRECSGDRAYRVGTMLVVSWLLVELAGAVPGGRFATYYFVPSVPPMLVLAAVGIARLTTCLDTGAIPCLQPVRRYVYGSILGLGFLAMSFQVSAIPDVVRLFGNGTLLQLTTNDDQQLSIAACVHEQVPIGDTFFIWGAQPALYFLSERAPATRFLYAFPLLNSFGGLSSEHYPAFPGLYDVEPLVNTLMTDLDHNKPAMVLIEPRFESYMVRLPQLLDYLHSHFVSTGECSGWPYWTQIER